MIYNLHLYPIYIPILFTLCRIHVRMVWIVPLMGRCWGCGTQRVQVSTWNESEIVIHSKKKSNGIRKCKEPWDFSPCCFLQTPSVAPVVPNGIGQIWQTNFNHLTSICCHGDELQTQLIHPFMVESNRFHPPTLGTVKNPWFPGCWWLEHKFYDFPFSWEWNVIIPTDELTSHHFSEG